MIRMPGRSHAGALEPLTAAEVAYRDELRRHVEHLAVTIGERHAGRPEALAKAGEYVAAELEKLGLAVKRLPYESGGQEFINYEAEIETEGLGGPVVVIGAHYDSAIGTPGANDNATGVAGLLVMAKMATDKGVWPGGPQANVRFVAFANEEPPHFQTPAMGSLVYAQRCRQAGDRVTAMLSLETIGYFRDESGSQSYPFPMSAFYPSTGNFIAFVGDTSSRDLVRQLVRSFRDQTKFPSEGAALPGAIPGVGWSDHWSFWQHGYPAVMVTDTAPFRYPHYHEPTDAPDEVDYDRLARVVVGLFRLLDEMVDYPIR
ncbi:MAG: M28 family peptidase [Deltaproteobacteria bacterium]|nr:M28 family peptidase [Deltaproteobacteria bacterium]MBW2532443.1 M28 family peptidase [Deltaproteobacteria bacterium]